jgi:hypothetical protein
MYPLVSVHVLKSDLCRLRITLQCYLCKMAGGRNTNSLSSGNSSNLRSLHLILVLENSCFSIILFEVIISLYNIKYFINVRLLHTISMD